MPRQLYALVKWVDSGENKNTYTSSIPIEWIVGFEADKFDPTTVDEEESYVIEWRDSKHMPRGGWKCYDGVVIDMSSRKSTLEKKLDQIEGQLSPRQVSNRRSRSPSHERESRKEKHGRKEKREKEISSKKSNKKDREHEHNDGGSTPSPSPSNGGHRLKDREQESDFGGSTPPFPLRNKRLRSENLNDNLAGTSRSLNLSKSDSFSGSIRPFLDNMPSERPKSFNEEVIRKLDDMGKRINKMEKMHETEKRIPASTAPTKPIPNNSGPARNGDVYYARPVSIHEIEIGRPESGVIITPEAWDAAKNQHTFTVTGLSLLSAVFDGAEMLTSNVKGGKCKINKNAVKKKALDSHKLNAIKYTVREMFPKTFNDAKMNTSINNKVSAICRAKRLEEMDVN